MLWRVWDLALGIVLIVIGLHMSGSSTTALQLVTFALLIASGMIILYSLWIVLMGLPFWFVKFDNNVTILQALTDTGRYPATVLPALAAPDRDLYRADRTATTVLLQALRGELLLRQVFVFLGAGLAAVLAIRWLK